MLHDRDHTADGTHKQIEGSVIHHIIWRTGVCDCVTKLVYPRRRRDAPCWTIRSGIVSHDANVEAVVIARRASSIETALPKIGRT